MGTRKITVGFAVVVLAIANIGIALAAVGGDLYLDSGSLFFGNDYFLEGKTVRTYVKVQNPSTQDLLGTVRVTDKTLGKQVGSDQVVSVVAGKTDTVFVDWVPTPGSKTLEAKIIPWETEGDNVANNNITKTVYVDYDTDKDGSANQYDDDDDNDGTVDDEDDFPLDPGEQFDTDGDGTGNNSDEDDDNDGTNDEEDDLPLDPNETIDTDNDGVGDNTDIDDDNDGLTDEEENGGGNSGNTDNSNENSNNANENTQGGGGGGTETSAGTGTDSKNPDTDGDNIIDGEDSFPLNPNEWSDFDRDGIGDNSDPDIDNDGIPNELDTNDKNKGPVITLSDDVGFQLPNDEFNLDGSPSYDEDGKIVSYEWTIDGKKQNEKGSNLKLAFDSSGEHVVTLSITDDKGETRTKEFKISVFNYKWLWLLIPLIMLALILAFKYTAGAKRRKPAKKQAKAGLEKPKKIASTKGKKHTLKKK